MQRLIWLFDGMVALVGLFLAAATIVWVVATMVKFINNKKEGRKK